MPQPDEWTTIAEAARRLRLSDRHARRLAEKMADSDRQRPTRGPVRVRLAALAAISTHLPAESDMADIPLEKSDIPADIVAELRQQIAGLQADKDRLHAMLDRRDQAEAELRKLLLVEKQELIELRQRLALTAAPAQDVTSPPQETQTGREQAEGSKDTSPRRWWEFWKR